MPRSNKKKHADQRAVPTGDATVELLLSKEQTLMIKRAMVIYLVKGLRMDYLLLYLGKCSKTWNQPKTRNTKPWHR